jgi:hypothetical protein
MLFVHMTVFSHKHSSQFTQKRKYLSRAVAQRPLFTVFANARAASRSNLSPVSRSKAGSVRQVAMV